MIFDQAIHEKEFLMSDFKVVPNLSKILWNLQKMS